MAGRLLFLFFIYSFHEVQTQALLPPKLTVSPAVITDTDSVRLNCRTPASVSVSQCYFYTLSGGTVKSGSCQQTLTGAELLKMSHQSSPAEVKVKCFYLQTSRSPDSETSSVSIQRPLPPKLTVSPAVITDTDSVTLNCQTPASLSVSQCFFHSLSGNTVRSFFCQQTLTASELLTMSRRSSPAEVKVKCSYNVKVGGLSFSSQKSDTSSISIQRVKTENEEKITDLTTINPIKTSPVVDASGDTGQKPQLSADHVPGDHVLFICSLPRSADGETRCNLYFGDKVRPDVTTKIRRETTKKKQSFCRFTVKINDFLQYLHLVLPKTASCDYRLGSEANSLSPRSDANSLTDIVEKELSITTTVSTIATTTGLTVGTLSITGSFTATSPTPVKPASVKPASAERWIMKVVAVVAGCGVTVGVILLVSATLWNRRRAGSEEKKRPEPQNENLDTYHLYNTITEEPTAPAAKSFTYSTVETH